MTREQLIKMKRAGMIEHAEKEFGVTFWKYTDADKILDQIMLQYEGRAKKEAEKRKPGRPAKV